MATRRHRLVIKPNIRPVGPKIGNVTPKPKTPSVSSAIESPSPAARAQPATPSVEEVSQLSVDEEERKGEGVSGAETCLGPAVSAVNVSVSDSQTGASHGGHSLEQEGSSVMLEASGSHKEKEPLSEDETIKGLSSLPNAAAAAPCAKTPTEQQSKKSKLSTPKTDSQALKSKDVANPEEVLKGKEAADEVEDNENPATPSEVDSCSILDTMSLDADDDKKGEAGDKSNKIRKWHKMKKTRMEPLPSREKSPDRQKMKMSDLLSWNPQQNFLPKKNKKKVPLKSENQLPSPSSSPNYDQDKESTNQSGSLPAPQIMIGPDGNIVLDAESLLIHTPKDESRPKEVLEDDDDDRYLNTNTYRSYKKPKQWTERETEKFFVGLSMCGTDFSLLTNLLPHRSRRELKNKFHREERKNRDLIDKALLNRQQYDVAPFEQMLAEDEKKKIKEMKRNIKKENNKMQKSKKRGRKRKKHSEDEEDDMGSEYDEENEENQDNDEDRQETAQVVAVKHKQRGAARVKKELDKPRQLDQNFPVSVPENPDMPFLPGYCRNSVNACENQGLEQPKYAGYSDLDDPRMRSRPTKTYSRHGSRGESNQGQVTSSGTGVSIQPSSVIQAIPGSNQVQIEMEGVQNPVQGVLIPSHLVPQIAPQLGIQDNVSGMQVLLVQEETESGSLVHVYVIPEADSAGTSMNPGVSGSSNHPVFTSPIPSPHPANPIQCPQQISAHPLAPACSPLPHSPEKFRLTASEPQTADPRHPLHPYTSPSQNNPHTLPPQGFSKHPLPPQGFSGHPLPPQGFSGPSPVSALNSIETIVPQASPSSGSSSDSRLTQLPPTMQQETQGSIKPETMYSHTTEPASSHTSVTCTNPPPLTCGTVFANMFCTENLHPSQSVAPFTSNAGHFVTDNARTSVQVLNQSTDRECSDDVNDCVILNSDVPESQPDRSALTCS